MDHTPDDESSAPDPAAGEQERVRRLLAQARHTGPVPPEVAARLDRVLGALEPLDRPDVPAADRTGGVVVDLAARRRRRAAALLVAAVAVVAVGLGASALRDPGTSADDAAGSASTARTAPADPAAPSADPAAPSAGAGAQGRSGGASGSEESEATPPPAALAPEDLDGPGAGDAAQGRGEVAVVRPTAFARDVRRIRATPGTTVTSARQLVGERSLGVGPGFVCSPPARYGAGRLVPVRYRGGAAVLVYRVPAGRSQTVDLLQCGTAQVLRSTTVPRR